MTIKWQGMRCMSQLNKQWRQWTNAGLNRTEKLTPEQTWFLSDMSVQTNSKYDASHQVVFEMTVVLEMPILKMKSCSYSNKNGIQNISRPPLYTTNTNASVIKHFFFTNVHTQTCFLADAAIAHFSPCCMLCIAEGNTAHNVCAMIA